MCEIIGAENFARLKRENVLQDSNANFLLDLARGMKDRPSDWRGLGYLNSETPGDWDRMLYKAIQLKPSGWDAQYSKIVAATKALAQNWSVGIPVILRDLASLKIDIEEFFHLERIITFKLSALLSDINELHKIIINPKVDIGKFIGKTSHAFLPSTVYHLEEYGLPRMIARKLHSSGFIDFSSEELDLRSALSILREIDSNVVSKIDTLSAFDKYILRVFVDGITPERSAST